MDLFTSKQLIGVLSNDNLMRDIRPEVNKMVFHQQTNYNVMNQYYWVVVIVAATFFILLPLVAWIWRSCRCSVGVYMFRLNRNWLTDDFDDSTTTGRDRFHRPSRTRFRRRINAHRKARATSDPNELDQKPAVSSTTSSAVRWFRTKLARQRSSSLNDVTPVSSFNSSVESLSRLLSRVGINRGRSTGSSRRNIVVVRGGGGSGGWGDSEDQHDRFNRRCPSKNYDKFPKRIRPRKPQGCELEDQEDASLVPLTSESRSHSLNSASIGCLGARRASDVSLPGLGPSSPSAIAAIACTAVVTPSAARTPSLDERRPSAVSRELDSLASWFQRLRWNSVREELGRRNSQNGSSRHYSRYDYTALEDNQSVHEKLEMERKVMRSQARGSRQNKFWFLVRDTNLKTERLLTMLPQTLHSPVHFSSVSKKTLSELFLALQHPYIYPVLDVDVKTLTDDEYVMVILPYNTKGSLKDIIHKARCQADWHDKYHHPSNGLPLATVQRLGRQILEALLFLQDRGFYPFGHLHCGNVIIQNGVSRLTGFEDTLLGYTSRCGSMVRKRLKDNYEAIDVICFGHVLFEMCAGYELNCAHPSCRHLDELQRTYPEIVDILKFIFEQEDGIYPSVEDISLLDFFRNMDLREMRSMPVPSLFQAQLSPAIQDLLHEVRLWHLSQYKWSASSSAPAKTPDPSYSSFLDNDVDGTVNEESSEDDMQLESSFMYGCCVSQRNTPNCSKRVRSSSSTDNDHRIARTTAVLETKYVTK
uniref:Protein kinase domain-containing protein n=1 Tax=Strigamia maritima TaxID=126957 RepID=T1IRE2_STRMM